MTKCVVHSEIAAGRLGGLWGVSHAYVTGTLLSVLSIQELVLLLQDLLVCFKCTVFAEEVELHLRVAVSDLRWWTEFDYPSGERLQRQCIGDMPWRDTVVWWVFYINLSSKQRYRSTKNTIRRFS